ncbi:MAG: flagellar filament capping protein FliD [Aquificae bacterium]|nr:flagellar filament capping protein FliD [Aquificota bacterium]
MAGELYFSGLTGTYDWGALVERVLALKSVPITKLDAQRQETLQKIQLLSGVSETLGELKNLLEGFNPQEALSQKKVSVDNPEVASVSASSQAPPISFTLEVLSVASTEMLLYGTGFSSLEETLGKDTLLTLRYYKDTTSYEEFTIELSASDTLGDIVRKINEAQELVRASVFFDGSRYKLLLSEVSPESSSVETATDLSVKVIHLIGELPPQIGTNTLLQGARNASVRLGNGEPIQSAGNTFENVIEGITISVKSVGTASVKVEESLSEAESFLSRFVELYNELVRSVRELTLGRGAPFSGEGALREIAFGLSDAVLPLLELGVVEYKEDGSVSVARPLSEVGDKEEILSALSRFLGEASSVVSGGWDALSELRELLEDRAERIGERIEILSERLRREEELLRRRLGLLESFMSYASDIRARLSDFVVSLSEMSGGK